MKRFLLYLLYTALPGIGAAQSPALLDSIEQHNTTLSALRAETEAQQLLAHSEQRLPDPEMELGYMVGTPKGVPGRTNVAVTQALDWGVITGRRRHLARTEADKAATAYRQGRQEILTEAAQLLTQAVYYNRLCRELEKRLQTAEALQSLYEKKLAQGETNQLEVNKVKLNVSVALAERKRAETARQGVMLDLQRLNGGRPVVCADTAYSRTELPAWADLQHAAEESHPQVANAQQAVAQSQLQARLTQAMAWPTLSVGFAGEYVKGNNYSGLSVGVSLPLWGNTRAKVRQSKAETLARQLDLNDVRTQLRTTLQQEYTSATALWQTAYQLHKDLAATVNDYLLHRALEEGQISVLDYLLEMSFYYTARTAYLEAERDAQLATTRLQSYLF